MPVLNRREPADRMAQARKRVKAADRARVVELARRHAGAAVQKLFELMNGQAGKVWVLDKAGALVQIDVEVPAAVQAECAEKLLERGFGKNPQAILIQEETPDGSKQFTIAEKIALIQARREGAPVVDLEASEITETPALPAPAEPPYEYPFRDPRDLV